MISLAIGILVGVIVAFVLKAQLKSVRKQTTAYVYTKNRVACMWTTSMIFSCIGM